MDKEPRTVRLRAWMANYNVTYRWIAQQLGVSAFGANKLLRAETMPVARHKQCLAIGIPEDLLPVPMDLPSGPKRRIPTFAIAR